MADNAALDTKAAEFPVNTGLAREDRKPLADGLSVALADSYSLYLKTQGFHWNVAGPLFYSLHKMTEEQYIDLAEAIDEIAERIRAIGQPAPASYSQFIQLSEIAEETGVPTAEDMVRQLVDGNETCARTMRKAAEKADELGDLKTSDLLTERLGVHEENAWMLRSLLA